MYHIIRVEVSSSLLTLISQGPFLVDVEAMFVPPISGVKASQVDPHTQPTVTLQQAVCGVGQP